MNAPSCRTRSARMTAARTPPGHTAASEALEPQPVVTALIADDEPLLRDHLRRHLLALWPGLGVVAEGRHGREALELFDHHRPDVAFLDVHMPGVSGIWWMIPL